MRVEDQCLNVVAYWDCKRGRVLYVELWGHPFGLSSAVLNYNRDSELHVALMRTILFTPCTHFYDDHLTVDPSFARGSGQSTHLDLCSLTGKCLHPDTHAAMSAHVVFAGCLLELSTAFPRVVLPWLQSPAASRRSFLSWTKFATQRMHSSSGCNASRQV